MKINHRRFLFGSIFAALVVCSIFVSRNHLNASDQEPGSTNNVTSLNAEAFAMMNALWFKPNGGKETYLNYMKSAGPFVAKYGGKPRSAYVPEANVIGEFDADLVFFVEWPNDEAFRNFLADPGYQAIKHLREEAIRDSLLIRCRKQK